MARLIETGDIYFFYEPRTDVRTVDGLQDVGRLYVILSGDRQFGRFCRLLTVDGVQLPLGRTAGLARRDIPAQVALVSDRPEDMEQWLARRRAGGPSGFTQRPVGEGRYALVEEDGRSDFVYALELPREPGPAQRDLGIERQARFGLARREVDGSAPVLQPADLREGVEVVLAAAGEQPSEQVLSSLGLQPEAPGTAEIFAELKLRHTDYPFETLYSGEWQ